MQKINSFLNRIKDLIEKYNYVFLFLIFIVFMLSRILFLDKRPCGVHVDEIAGALDAKYISEYGMDRHLDRMPVYFKNYGGGMSAMYVYLLALLFKIMPYSVFTIRLPAVICGILCFIYSYKLVNMIFCNNTIALLGPFFVTILPYYMSSERWGLDCNLFLSILTISIYYFIKANISRKYFSYLSAGIWLGITLYTYAISYVVLLLFLGIYFIYELIKKRLEIKKWAVMGIPLFLLALPLMLFQLVNMGIISEFSFLFSDYHKLVFYRASEMSINNFINNIPFLSVILLGGDGLRYNSFDNIAYGTVYIIMVPIIIFGIIYYILKICKKSTIQDEQNSSENIGMMCIFILLVSSVMVVLLLSAPSINKTNQIYLPLMIFVIYGIVNIQKRWKYSIICFVIICSVFFLLYSKFYFIDQKTEYGYLELFHPTISLDIIRYSEKMYDENHDKTIYFEEQYEDLGKEEMILHAIGSIPPTDFDEERIDYGKYKLHFPENFDENENAIYILGKNWSHITGYLQSIGYNVDNCFENYSIVYR